MERITDSYSRLSEVDGQKVWGFSCPEITWEIIVSLEVCAEIVVKSYKTMESLKKTDWL